MTPDWKSERRNGREESVVLQILVIYGLQRPWNTVSGCVEVALGGGGRRR